MDDGTVFTHGLNYSFDCKRTAGKHQVIDWAALAKSSRTLCMFILWRFCRLPACHMFHRAIIIPASLPRNHQTLCVRSSSPAQQHYSLDLSHLQHNNRTCLNTTNHKNQRHTQIASHGHRLRPHPGGIPPSPPRAQRRSFILFHHRRLTAIAATTTITTARSDR